LEQASQCCRSVGDSHKQVWEKFDNSPDASCKRLRETGNFLKEKRVTADYRPNYPRIQEDLPLLIEKANEFAKKLSELDPKLPRNTGVQWLVSGAVLRVFSASVRRLLNRLMGESSHQIAF